jgi:Protein of unknown function (DUF1579)
MRLAACALIAVPVVLASCGGPGEHMQTGQRPSEAEMKAMMETYAELATPGEHHKRLETLSGTWNTTTKSWMDPAQRPMESKGSCEYKMILGGRFLKATCVGEMMGNEFTGIGVTGFDNHTKKYQETWMDSMGTAQYCLEGPAGSDPNVITTEGMYDDPMQGPMKLRAVTRIVDNHTHVFEMYGTGKDSQEQKMMEITYTRKK